MGPLRAEGREGRGRKEIFQSGFDVGEGAEGGRGQARLGKFTFDLRNADRFLVTRIGRGSYSNKFLTKMKLEKFQSRFNPLSPCGNHEKGESDLYLYMTE